MTLEVAMPRALLLACEGLSRRRLDAALLTFPAQGLGLVAYPPPHCVAEGTERVSRSSRWEFRRPSGRRYAQVIYTESPRAPAFMPPVPAIGLVALFFEVGHVGGMFAALFVPLGTVLTIVEGTAGPLIAAAVLAVTLEFLAWRRFQGQRYALRDALAAHIEFVMASAAGDTTLLAAAGVPNDPIAAPPDAGASAESPPDVTPPDEAPDEAPPESPPEGDPGEAP